MTKFLVIRGMYKDIEDGKLQFAEESLEGQGDSLQMQLMQGSETIGSLSVSYRKGNVEVYIPSTPTSQVTKSGDNQFCLKFVEQGEATPQPYKTTVPYLSLPLAIQEDKDQ